MIIVRPPSIPFIPMGMNKNGSDDIEKQTSRKVTGWIERPGYPGSQIVNDELVANGDGNITIYASLTRSGKNSTNDRSYIYINGVQVVQSATWNFDETKEITWTGSISNGASISVWFNNTNAFSSNSITGGYVYYTINP